MRFDLLDEYSALVPSRRGISRNGALQDSNVQAQAAKHGAIANFASRLELLRKLLGAFRPMKALPRILDRRAEPFPGRQSN